MANVLTLNHGSSSIKFALFQTDTVMQRMLSGKIERIGLPGTRLGYCDAQKGVEDHFMLEAPDHGAAANFLLGWLARQSDFSQVVAVGHRIVHGMQHVQPERVTPALLAELQRISAYDPEHLPGEIELIETCQRHYPLLPQVACFDTAFHHCLPRVAKLLPIPRRFEAMGIRRYGFHGLSYASLMQQLAQVAGPTAAHDRVILAHLGNGCSLAAVREGRCIDTSMGFTPCGGVMMGTRSGDLDPGVAWYLMQSEKLTAQQFSQMINHQSGLLGVSEASSDMRDLLVRASQDVRAAEAVELFCYQVKKWLGSYAAVLGGVDTLLFSGGIGENSAAVRARICSGLEFLGIAIDAARNSQNAAVISTQTGRVTVRVMHTDEELMIAQTVRHMPGVCEHDAVALEKENDHADEHKKS